MNLFRATLFIGTIAFSLLFISCSNNQDFAYNEKITSDFYGCKERLDETHQKLLNGKFDLAPKDGISFEFALKEAKGLASYCIETKTTANELKHSEFASEFHSNTIEFMSKIANDYAPVLEQYINQSDSIKRKEIKLQLIEKKNELITLEDKCLETQIAFLNKAGIKINEATKP